MLLDVSQSVYLLGKVESGGLTPLGSAFALGGRKIATALHVVRDAQNLQFVEPRASVGGYQDATDPSVTVQPVTLIEANPVRDLAILEVSADTEMTVAYHLGSTDELLPGMPITVCGYPHAESGRFVLTQHSTTVGAKVVLANQGIRTKHVVLNTLLRPGQSGGLVLNPVALSVVAVVIGPHRPAAAGPGGILISGVDPAALNQTAHAVSAEYLAEMLR